VLLCIHAEFVASPYMYLPKALSYKNVTHKLRLHVLGAKLSHCRVCVMKCRKEVSADNILRKLAWKGDVHDASQLCSVLTLHARDEKYRIQIETARGGRRVVIFIQSGSVCSNRRDDACSPAIHCRDFKWLPP